tara:strand:- start:2031 stop:2345 length:315 start_codon:yes stop_codon:yes gene_type:complete
MRYKAFLFLSIFLFGTTLQSQSYLKEDENTKILKEILKEISELKKGQDKLSKEIKTLKTAQSKNQDKSGGNKAASTIKNVPVGNSMVLGNPKAPVTIVKWTDFQ